MKLSARVHAAQESQTLQIAAKAKAMKQQGIDVISLSTGEPDFPTPDWAKQAAIQAIHDNFTYYMEVNGIPELREAVAEKFRTENNIMAATADTVLVSTGVKQALFNALMAMCNEGDEVITIAPYWVSYPAIVTMCGATPVIINTKFSNRYKLQPDQLRAALTPKTKCVILNIPCNPTGAMYTPDEMRELVDVLAEHSCYIISDEIYEKIVYGDVPHTSIGSYSELAGRVLTMNGVAKAFAMPGWRIGYTHAAPEIIKQMNKVQGQSTSHPCTIAQKAALGALRYAHEDVERMRIEFAYRRELICRLLNDISGIQFYIPEGAFYIFANVSAVLNGDIQTSSAFCEYLLERFHLALVPGEAFGADGSVRFSFASSRDVVSNGVQRFADAVHSLR